MKPCKHKFQARYDKVWTTDFAEAIKCMASAELVGDEPYLKSQTYIHDVCVRCGTVINKG